MRLKLSHPMRGCLTASVDVSLPGYHQLSHLWQHPALSHQASTVQECLWWGDLQEAQEILANANGHLSTPHGLTLSDGGISHRPSSLNAICVPQHVGGELATPLQGTQAMPIA